MSDLADSIFQAKLVGEALNGTPVDSSTVQQAAMEAGLAASLFPDDELSPTEETILQAKMLQNMQENGSVDIDPGDVFQAQMDAELIDGFLD